MSDGPLFDAIMSGDEEVAMQWIRQGKPLDIDMDDGSSALQLAVRNNMYTLAEALIDAGIDINIQNRYGMAILHSLITMLDRESVSQQLASTERQDSGEVLGVIRKILSKNANLELKRYEDECTPLMLAAAYGYEDVVLQLLEAGAEVNADSLGGGGLHRAGADGHSDVVRLLLEYGANVDDTDQSSQTPLMTTSVGGHLECVKAILAAGANVNHQSNSGFTALIYAARFGHVDVVRTLIESGADISLTDVEGNGPFEHARIENMDHIIPELSR